MAHPLLNAAALALLCPLVSGQTETKLLPSDGAAFDNFGWSVAISSPTAIVGSPYDDTNGSASGSAYLFDAATGAQIAKLLPSDGAADDYFGVSVAISGSIAIVGSPSDDDSGLQSGSAYSFDTTTGAQIAKLLWSGSAVNDFFGWSVAISGPTAIVGAPYDDHGPTLLDSGSAYRFDAATGALTLGFSRGDGAAGDYFGWSVAISGAPAVGARAVIGAWGDDDNGSNSGSAYLFDTTTGAQMAKLLPSDGASYDFFGTSVAISGTTAIVGAHWDDDNGGDSGSAYLFDTTTGAQIAKLLPSDGATDDHFGISVAISSPTAIVGARYDDDDGMDSGSAYLLDQENNHCTNATPLFGDGVFAVDNTMGSGPDAEPG